MSSVVKLSTADPGAPKSVTRCVAFAFAKFGRPMPVAGPGEVVVRVAATAVCHTDLSIYTGRHPGVRYPVVLGHEATGRAVRSRPAAG